MGMRGIARLVLIDCPFKGRMCEGLEVKLVGIEFDFFRLIGIAKMDSECPTINRAHL